MSGQAIERSAFDSDVFGVDFYRVVDADAGRIASAMEALAPGPLIVDAKLPAADPDLVAGFQVLGFSKASTLVEFAASPMAGVGPDAAQSHELSLDAADLDAHAEAFRFQRFMQDGRIPKARSVELMRRWIANSLAGRRETVAIGRNFCTYGVAGGCLTIDLLSCLDQGQGMAGRLLEAIHAEAAARNCDTVVVTTEAENVRAMRVYLAAGFRPRTAWAAMHYVRGVAS